MNNRKYVIIFIILVSASYSFFGEDRFPRPEFQSDYDFPTTTVPAPRDSFYDYLDIGVLFLMLTLTSYFALKQRSRTGIFFCSLFSILYFGFWKKGCICSIGSIQNIAYSLFSGSYAIPVSVALFFSLPLFFALLFGRVFCGGVCPFGALQDLVALKPITLPRWLDNILKVFPALYLGVAVLFAATGSGFIICRFDPFVGFFRFGATFEMFITGGVILLIGIVIARPYCRFLCPYGVLLSWASRLSQWHVKITRDDCIECKLCDDICPVGAIQKPIPASEVEKKETGIKRLMVFFIVLPLVVFGTGFLLSRISPFIAQFHPMVNLAEQVSLENKGIAEVTTDASDAFRGTGTPFEELMQDAQKIYAQFDTGTWLLGFYVGLIIMLSLIRLSVFRIIPGYTIEKGECVSCGRCLSVCPLEHKKTGRKNDDE
ncbi:MAG: 4Fe-4S binding protein [Spirochaetales bacterium]|nr:4Fe-4S binding protein [Spirochaetales bacterium]